MLNSENILILQFNVPCSLCYSQFQLTLFLEKQTKFHSTFKDQTI